MSVVGHTEKTTPSVNPPALSCSVQQDLLALGEPVGTSPLQEINDSLLKQAGIRLLVKRDDLIHPCFGGNKWRKLKYHIDAMQSAGHSTLLTFGGAWSNHIHATAGAGKYFGFNTIGVIRGEPGPTPSATLEFANACGMQLHYISRLVYRKHASGTAVQDLPGLYNMKAVKPYIVPEGGKSMLAVRGCADIVDEIDQPFDIICCSSGTGTSLAGIIVALTQSTRHSGARAIGFSALKIPQSLKANSPLADDIRTLVDDYYTNHPSTDTERQYSGNWDIDSDYHFGGYARINDELIAYIRQFYHRHNIMLDAVYTGKMFYGLFRRIASGEFTRGTTIVAVHSGGLQGNRGFNL